MRRLAVFVFFDKSGVAGKYVDYFLSELYKNVEKIVIICNGSLTSETRDIFSRYSDSIYVRDNRGFEAEAWREFVLEYSKNLNIAQYDEILFSNDIFYGPIFPLEEVILQMEKREHLHFWGITRHYEATDFTGSHVNGIIPEHIQTYFFAVRRSLFVHNDFKEFWKKMPPIRTYQDDVGKFETSFTQFFASRGYKWDTAVDLSMYRDKGLNNYCFNYDWPYTLISKHRMPFIRRKALTQYIQNSSSGPEVEAHRVLDYISNNSDYDVGFIWEDLLRKNNIYDLYLKLHLNYIFPSKSIIYNREKQGNAALLMHIYYKDQVEYCLQKAKNMPEDIDIYISTPLENIQYVRDKFKQLASHYVEVRDVNTRGRDMSALFVGMQDVLNNEKYDYVCCIHDKKSPQVGLLFGRAFRDITFDSMMFTREYVENILGFLEKNSHLGCLGFPKMIGGPFWPVYSKSWASDNNFSRTKSILKKCGIEVPVSEDKPPIIYANVFWCKRKALKPLCDLKLDYDDFDPEPLAIDGTFSHALERCLTYVVQSQGFYSGVTFTDEYAAVYLSALSDKYMQVTLHSGTSTNVLRFSVIRRFAKKMGNLLRPYPKVYGLAYRVWLRISS